MCEIENTAGQEEFRIIGAEISGPPNGERLSGHDVVGVQLLPAVPARLGPRWCPPDLLSAAWTERQIRRQVGREHCNSANLNIAICTVFASGCVLNVMDGDGEPFELFVVQVSAMSGCKPSIEPPALELAFDSVRPAPTEENNVEAYV